VNLIGDHTDYNGLAVLPMAIEQEVAVALRARADGEVHLANVDPLFEPVAFEMGPLIAPHPAGHWANYAKAAVQALASAHGARAGFDGLVVGNIPQAAGLSSSSALVVACALALAHVNQVVADRLALAERLADAEHYVGTRGGGMDQAICLGARAGTATRIDFNPLRLVALPVPSHWRFVVAFSGVRAAKSAGARERYNRRTRECAQAFSSIARRLQLPAEARTWAAMIARSSPATLLLLGDRVLPLPARLRFRHVVSEAARLDAAEDALRAGDRRAFGALMNESHRSLRDDYAVSCAELDELVTIAGRAGADGARLTGAGFGGCVVALCGNEEAFALGRRWREDFYRPRDLEVEAEEWTFVVEPSEGATVTLV
jgi:galactokinase